MELKKLGIRALQGAAYAHGEYFLNLRSLGFEVSVADLMNPVFWREHTRRLRPNDLIRVVAADGSYDFQLNVVAVCQGGVVVEPARAGAPPTEAQLQAAREAQAFARAEAEALDQLHLGSGARA
jgi:hypothetical protein